MNVLKTTLTTSEVAGIIFQTNEKVNQHLADMLSGGLIDADKIKTKPGVGTIDPTAANRFGIVELIKLSVHAALPAIDVVNLANAWATKHSIEVKAHIRKERRARRTTEASGADHREVLRRFFCDKPRFMALVMGQDGPAGGELGMIRASGTLVVGSSTPVVRLALARSGLSPKQLIAALKSLPGGCSTGTKRFAGHPSKSITVPIAGLRAAIQGEVSDHA